MRKLISLLLLIISLPLIAGHHKKPHYKYDLSACMIFRDEAPCLKEWIEFHVLLGVEHFYLYNNLSQDNYKEVLQPYVNSGIVELIEWNQESHNVGEWDAIQVAAYNDGFVRSREK